MGYTRFADSLQSSPKALEKSLLDGIKKKTFARTPSFVSNNRDEFRGRGPLSREFTPPHTGTSHTKEQVPKCVAATQTREKVWALGTNFCELGFQANEHLGLQPLVRIVHSVDAQSPLHHLTLGGEFS